jgi:hypothetical protein
MPPDDFDAFMEFMLREEGIIEDREREENYEDDLKRLQQHIFSEIINEMHKDIQSEKNDKIINNAKDSKQINNQKEKTKEDNSEKCNTKETNKRKIFLLSEEVDNNE